MSMKGSKKLNDGHLIGVVDPTCLECERCGVEAIGVHIHSLILPPRVKPKDRRIIAKPDMFLGISCGCYANFQRQMAYIKVKQQRSTS